MVPMVPYVLLYEAEDAVWIERMNALPELLFSDEASMRLVGFNAPQVRTGVPTRAAKRQGPRTTGPICRRPWAKNIVKLDLRALEALFTVAISGLAKAGVFQAKVMGWWDGTDLEPTAQYEGCGQVTRNGAHR